MLNGHGYVYGGDYINHLYSTVRKVLSLAVGQRYFCEKYFLEQVDKYPQRTVARLMLFGAGSTERPFNQRELRVWYLQRLVSVAFIGARLTRHEMTIYRREVSRRV